MGYLVDSEKMVETSRLRAFELFVRLKEEDLTEIARICKEVMVPSGTILIRQGQVGKEVYLLEEGSVGIYREGTHIPQFLGALQAPTILGEMAMLDPERIRTVNVKALSNLRLLTISIDSFLPYIRLFPPLRENCGS